MTIAFQLAVFALIATSSIFKFITPAHSHFGRNRSTNSLIPVSKEGP